MKKDQKVMFTHHFYDEGLRSFRSKFSRKVWETDRVLKLRLHMVVLPVSMTISWPAKTEKKFDIKT